jgi:hypothetical protein
MSQDFLSFVDEKVGKSKKPDFLSFVDTTIPVKKQKGFEGVIGGLAESLSKSKVLYGGVGSMGDMTEGPNAVMRSMMDTTVPLDWKYGKELAGNIPKNLKAMLIDTPKQMRSIVAGGPVEKGLSDPALARFPFLRQVMPEKPSVESTPAPSVIDAGKGIYEAAKGVLGFVPDLMGQLAIEPRKTVRDRPLDVAAVLAPFAKGVKINRSGPITSAEMGEIFRSVGEEMKPDFPVPEGVKEVLKETAKKMRKPKSSEGDMRSAIKVLREVMVEEAKVEKPAPMTAESPDFMLKPEDKAAIKASAPRKKSDPMRSRTFKELSSESDRIQSRIDELHDKLIGEGVPFEKHESNPALEALYAERIKYDTAAAGKAYDGARKIIDSELGDGVPRESTYSSVDSILSEHYSLTPNPDGAYFLSKYTGKALSNPETVKNVARNITQLLFSKEYPRADFWATMESGMSGLTAKGKTELIGRGVEIAKQVHEKIGNFLMEDKATIKASAPKPPVNLVRDAEGRLVLPDVTPRLPPEIISKRDALARKLGYDPQDLPIEPLPKAHAKIFPITRDVDLALGITAEAYPPIGGSVQFVSETPPPRVKGVKPTKENPAVRVPRIPLPKAGFVVAPPESRVPLKARTSSKAPVYADEVMPFVEKKYPDLKRETTLNKIHAAGENPYRSWERIPEAHRLIQDYNAGTTAVRRQQKALADQVFALEKEYSKPDLLNIGANAVGRQKGGIAHLLNTKDFKGEIKPLDPHGLALDSQIRSQQKAYLEKLNAARELTGNAPIKSLGDDYFTFATNVEELGKNGFSLITDPIAAIENAVANHTKPVKKMNFPFEKSRKKGASTPVILDPLKVLQIYGNRIIEIEHLTPILAKGQSLLSEIEVPTPTGTITKAGRVSKKPYSLWRLADDYPNLAGDIRSWLDTIAGKHMGTNNTLLRFFERAGLKLGKHIAISTMGGNFRSASIQPSALAGAMDQLGYPSIARGITRNLSDKWRKFSDEHSQVLPGRNIDVETYKYGDKTVHKTIGEALQSIGRASMVPLRFLDMETARSTWLAAQDFGIKTGLSQAESYLWADQIVLKTQGSGLPGHVAPIQRSPGGRLATLFQTFGINQWNHLVKDVLGVGETRIRSAQDTSRVIMTLRLLSATMLFNTIFEDIIGIRSPFPTPIREVKRSIERGDSALGSAWSGVKEMAQWHPFGSSLRWSSAGRTAVPAIADPIIGEKGAINMVNKIASGAKMGPRDFEVIGKILGIPFTTQTAKTLSRLEQGFNLPQAFTGVRADVPRKDAKKKPKSFYDELEIK